MHKKFRFFAPLWGVKDIRSSLMTETYSRALEIPESCDTIRLSIQKATWSCRFVRKFQRILLSFTLDEIIHWLIDKKSFCSRQPETINKTFRSLFSTPCFVRKFFIVRKPFNIETCTTTRISYIFQPINFQRGSRFTVFYFTSFVFGVAWLTENTHWTRASCKGIEFPVRAVHVFVMSAWCFARFRQQRTNRYWIVPVTHNIFSFVSVVFRRGWLKIYAVNQKWLCITKMLHY